MWLEITENPVVDVGFFVNGATRTKLVNGVATKDGGSSLIIGKTFSLTRNGRYTAIGKKFQMPCADWISPLGLQKKWPSTQEHRGAKAKTFDGELTIQRILSQKVIALSIWSFQ